MNQTFKAHYWATTCFGSQAGSVTFMTLFAAYFNFLRPYNSLEGNISVITPILETMPYIPAQWTKLLALAQAALAE
ncbi:hypothetical protein P9B03_10275 [Metasolibacillus meyeri]|uniref:Uncharacterized protein n=1 Tax=Metasolibacillus meyeri TaxID=1071052 RepID=A0AAW9NW90_9BACL|nr:hypothetical protein [Metasolibacillus meyeri]MEC1178870.1 hypothetical protein [Metasolibacillus meyeri]